MMSSIKWSSKHVFTKEKYKIQFYYLNIKIN